MSANRFKKVLFELDCRSLSLEDCRSCTNLISERCKVFKGERGDLFDSSTRYVTKRVHAPQRRSSRFASKGRKTFAKILTNSLPQGRRLSRHHSSLSSDHSNSSPTNASRRSGNAIEQSSLVDSTFKSVRLSSSRTSFAFVFISSSPSSLFLFLTLFAFRSRGLGASCTSSC